MTHANNTQAIHTPWFARAGAASSIVPISRFVAPGVFALKVGGYGCLFALRGVDEEALTDQELDSRLLSVEGALRGLPHGSTLYQYTRIRPGYALPRQSSYPYEQTELFAQHRLDHLNRNANFRRIDLHWCLIVQADQFAEIRLRRPKENAEHNQRLLTQLQKTATILETQLDGPIGIQRLMSEPTFQFFSYLFNLTDWSENAHLDGDTGLDRQMVQSAIAWKNDCIQIGKRFAQVFSLSATPEATRPCLFSALHTVECDAVLCTTWHPRSDDAVRKEITSQEKFIEFFKTGLMNRAMSGRDTAQIDRSAGGRAADFKIEDLGEVVRSLDKKSQGEFSLRLLLVADTHNKLREIAPEVHKLFVDARARVMEETFGNLSAFYAMFPGNQQFNVFPLWLGEDHHARLASIFAPDLGHSHSEDLDHEYLNIFETRSKTPFFQDVYVNGVRVQLILGPTGTGKSVHANQMLALEQKYGGFSYIFDIGASYESLVELYGGKVDRIGTDGPRCNPFALEPTEPNLKFLYSFIRLLLTSGGAMLSPEDEDVVYQTVQGMYNLAPENRTLSNLCLPRHLDRYMSKWTGNGVYAAIFDNVEDSLSLSRIQCFDFQRATKDYPDLIEPLMVWLLRRINDVLFDPKNLGVPKHILIEELFSSMKNKQLLEAALASIKTVRKNLGGVTLIGQSADDLGENADSIVNSCTSFLFLRDETFNRKKYAELFKMSTQQIALFESLQGREALYMRRDGVTKVITLNLDPRSYATFSTRPKDRVRRSRLIEKYGLREGIERFAEGEIA